MDVARQQRPEDPRNRWTAERTRLAWLRTTLALMGFGFVVARFGFFLRQLAGADERSAARVTGHSIAIGVGLVILGVVVTLQAAKEHVQIIGRLKRGEPFVPPGWSLGFVFALFLPGVGRLWRSI